MGKIAMHLTGEAVRQKLGTLIELASTSPSLRAQLLSDPKKTVEDFFRIKLPDSVVVKSIAEEPNTLTVVVPPSAPSEKPDSELNLEKITDMVGAAYSSILECPMK